MLVAQSFGNFWNYWTATGTTTEDGWKVWFDGEQKIIQIHQGILTVTADRDLYSTWKEWMMMYDNAKYEQALRTVGGDPISATEALGDTYFLTNGWRIRPWSGDYQLDIEGNLYVDGGVGSIAVDPTEASNIIVNLKTSVLVNRQYIDNTVIVETVNQVFLDLLNSIDTTTQALPSANQITQEVWSKPTDELTDKDTIGGFIVKRLLSVIKFLSLK